MKSPNYVWAILDVDGTVLTLGISKPCLTDWEKGIGRKIVKFVRVKNEPHESHG